MSLMIDEVDEQDNMLNIDDNQHFAKLTREARRVENNDPESDLGSSDLDPLYEDDDDDASIHHGNENEDDNTALGFAIHSQDRASAGLGVAPNISSKITGNLARNLEKLLTEWQEHHDGEGPKCATRLNRQEVPGLRFDRSSGDPAAWLHVSGEILQVSAYRVPESLNCQQVRKSDEWRYIVVEGQALQPSILRFRTMGYLEPFEERGALYKIWVGIEGDEDGFEEGASVIKIRKPLDETCDADTESSRGSGPTVPSSTRVRLGRQPGEFAKPVIVLPKPRQAAFKPREQQTKRRKLYISDDDDDVDEEVETVESESLPTRPKTPVTAPTRRKSSPESDVYIKENTQIVFFSTQSQQRTRPLSACDTVTKLFAQARAGKVFNEKDSRVLTMQIDKGGEDVPIVEHDPADFDLFVEQLKQAACWKTVNKKITGDCTVEARELQ